MSHRALGPMFHGTYAGWLRKGQLLVPGGVSNFGISSPTHVYLTSDPEEARWYADQTYRQLERQNFKIGNVPVHGASPTVYEAHPLAGIEQDPNLGSGDSPTSFRTTRARIVGRLK